ncbi:flagellar M-ring protein FliF C-terminal domain-containing protein, partial [Verminephrobacter aporrectodeae]|uniref:flagellar M-ring protein FliF C-terminal domain-containing protein n=1 Tax=Verminephrobacter aporrectodeae TaxID=1110389 RepID=UPI0002376244
EQRQFRQRNGANPAPDAGGQQGAQATSRRESTTNYELDRSLQVTRGATGSVKRLSAAVVVNYQLDEAKGRSRALAPEQIEQMTALVRESIGFNRERGDSVNLMHTPFLVRATPPVDVPLWQRPEVIELAKTFAWPLGAVLFAALVLLGLVRPALKGAAPRAVAGGQIDALEAEALERPALPTPSDAALPATPEQLRLEEARVLARENPVAVANILKTWLSGESA